MLHYSGQPDPAPPRVGDLYMHEATTCLSQIGLDLMTRTRRPKSGPHLQTLVHHRSSFVTVSWFSHKPMSKVVSIYKYPGMEWIPCIYMYHDHAAFRCVNICIIFDATKIHCSIIHLFAGHITMSYTRKLPTKQISMLLFIPNI